MDSQIIAEISRVDLADLPGREGRITGFSQLASYNWLEKAVPTILVPGSPPLLSPPSALQKLAPDSGLVYIHQNAARNPRFPLEPLFRALYDDDPYFHVGDIDLVTDRNNILKLLRFARGSSSDAFQIRVEIAGSRTALFTRVEAKTTDIIQGFRGYGHTFEQAYTEAERGSSAHHRIVGYNLGGMKCIVRHETDGYVVDDKSVKEVVASGLSDALEGLSISKPDEIGNSSAITIVKTGGRAIKTRAAGHELDMAEVCSQLWVSQTRKLVVGYHRNGLFDNIQLRDMTDRIRQWEMANKKDLGKLACLLAKIIGVVKRSGDRGTLVDYSGGERLSIIAGDGKRALPDDLYQKWEAKQQRDIDNAQAGREDVTKLSKDDEVEAVGTRQRPEEDPTPSLIPKGTPFAEHIEHAMRNGFRQFFRRMPTDLSDYRALCGTLKLLPKVDVLAGRNLRAIMDDMRKGKSDWDLDDGCVIKGLKSLGRDSAFRLVYLLLVDEGGEAGAVDQSPAYNAALFVVSHPGIFKYRTRKMVREAFEDRFNVSYKQRQNLDKWAVGPQEVGGSDVTTEEDDFDFDSDFDYYSD